MRLTVMTYNIHIGVPMGFNFNEYISGKIDMENIASIIQNSGAHIIGLNEVDRHYAKNNQSRSGYLNQAFELAKLLNMNYAFGSTRDDGDYPGLSMTDDIEWKNATNIYRSKIPQGAYGNAQLTSYPIQKVENYSLPNNPKNEKRALLMTEQVINGNIFHIYNTHLQNPGIPDSASDRWMQIQEIKKIILKDSTKYKIILGDFNWDMNNPEMEMYNDPKYNIINEIISIGILDTTNINTPPENTFPSNKPIRRIDYILVSPEIKIIKSNVIKTLFSDHLPVITILEI